MTQTVGLAVIAKNEAENLPRLLESIAGAFDQVVLLDTGSTDGTPELFIRWARAEEDAGRLPDWKCELFEWVDDFAAARTAADELLHTDWLVWADCDDTIEHPEVLRQLAADAAPEVAGFIFGYDYAREPETGVCLCHLRRERLVRRGRGRWVGRVHEAQVLDGPAQPVADQLCRWVHHKVSDSPEAAQRSNDRNLQILRRWVQDEPHNPRVLGYLGTENAVRGNHAEAVEWYAKYLAEEPGWDEERAQIHRKLSASLIALGRVDEAQQSALQALTVMPSWPDSYISLAECSLLRDEPAKALEWAQRIGPPPDTLLIINPLDYTWLPHRLRAAALAELGRHDEAVAEAEAGLALFDEGGLRALWADQRQTAKREHTAQTYAMAAEQLVAHDEQLKALTLLEHCVPYFATDHPRVVALRSFLRERLAWVHEPQAFAAHYSDGGTKPEDHHDDEGGHTDAEALPRVAYLLEDLRELGAAA